MIILLCPYSRASQTLLDKKRNASVFCLGHILVCAILRGGSAEETQRLHFKPLNSFSHDCHQKMVQTPKIAPPTDQKEI